MASLAPEQPDVVWFSGSDALRFLNDIISQELGDMEPGDARRSLLLAPQGKLDFLLWVIMDETRIGLLTDPGRGEALGTALGRYRIRVDVDITPEGGDVWIVVGEWDGYDISWAGVERHLVIGDRPDLDVMPDSDYESLRVDAGEPKWGVDVDGDTIPHESGLVPASVDFAKGCFLGQELVARIDSRGGNTPRNLLRLESDRPLRPGDPVTLEGNDVGRVTSSAGAVGLAMLKRSITVGDRVEVGGSEAIVMELPAKTH